MELFIIILLAVIAGYMLAGSRLDQWLGNRSTDVKTWYQDRFQRGKVVDSFRIWVAGPDGDSLSDEFKIWLAGLTDEELGAFLHALSAFLKDLDYDLTALLSGDLNDQPGHKQAVLNAIMDYSHSYQDAARIRQEALQNNG
jgi:hypothetical protein